MTGAGAAAVLGATVLGARLANAEPAGPDLSDGPDGDKRDLVDASQVLETIGSAPISGYNYRHLMWSDFKPWRSSGGYAYGGYGRYTPNDHERLDASLDLPAGALVRDIEWYVYNNSGSSWTARAGLWVASSANSALLADAAIPTNPETITATRVVVPAANWGPHPLGTKINLAIITPTTGTVQINGARVGFSRGVAEQGFLPAPSRAYDSRSTGGKLAAGATRTITLSSSIVRPGMTGVLINVAAVEGASAGHLRVYPGNASLPSASSLNFQGGVTTVNQITVGVTAARQIKVYASRSVHIVVDVIGTFG